MVHLEVSYFMGRLLALLINIRLVRKNFLETNALAYYVTSIREVFLNGKI
jgi:hypothetical protein